MVVIFLLSGSAGPRESGNFTQIPATLDGCLIIDGKQYFSDWAKFPFHEALVVPSVEPHISSTTRSS